MVACITFQRACSFLIFDAQVDAVNITGMCIAIVGMVLYTHFKMKDGNPSSKPISDIVQASELSDTECCDSESPAILSTNRELVDTDDLLTNSIAIAAKT